ncbi:MAG TPA: POTRA domain-containing protein [Chitinophagaceae bacterium]|nr:POTRA domain-containing protein [Chitinophagaceae bacterium]
MQKFFISLFLAITCCMGSYISYGQLPGLNSANSGDTTITNLNPDLLNIFTQRQPQKYKVAGIKVTGNKYFDEALLISVSGLNVGDEITIPGGENFSKAISKLWAQNYFSDVTIYITKLQGNNIWLEINVTERPRLSKFYFLGVPKGQSDDLKEKTALVVNRVITENMKRTASDAIKKYYADKGFPLATVRITQQKDTLLENTAMLLFDIDKGKKEKINDINFIDNTVDANQLKHSLKDTKEKMHLTLHPIDGSGGLAPAKIYSFKDYLHEQGYLTFTKTRKLLSPYIRLKPFTSAKFNSAKYEDDKNKLIDYYNSLGYRDAVIVADSKKLDTARGLMNIDIKVDEGHKYYFGNITWRGNTRYSDSILTVILGIHKGDIYNSELLNKRLGKNVSPEGGDISGLYYDEGYLFFRIDPVETAVYNDTIDFEIRITEGSVATWKNVRISGNEKTKEYVIRRELRTIPGEKFSRSDVIRTNRELAQLGFFDQEKIVPDIVPNPDDGTVDVTWKLVEKSSDQLELSAGFGGGIGLTGTLGVTFNNFSIKNIFSKKAWDPLPTGDGQKLSIRFQSNGAAYRSYNVSFTEPWLGGTKRNSLNISLYDTKFSNAYNPYTLTYDNAAADSSYFRTTGFALGLGKQLKWPDDFFSFGVTLNYARYTLKNYPIDRNLVLKDGSILNNGHSNNLSLKFVLQRTSISNPTFPTYGSNFMLSLQLTPPYSLFDKSLVNSENPYKWVEYHKWRFTGEWYVPIGRATGEDKNKQFVLKMAAKYGFIGRYNSNLQISPFERFQVGDAGLSNSYALLGYDIISQRGYPVYETSDPRVNPDQQGASQYFTIFNKYTLELRYPLSLSTSSTIYALTFFEAANGWYSFKDYDPFRLRRSVGIGARFFLPMFGLLGFDYGIGLDRITPGSGLKNSGRFTFMLGYEPD